jgi:hypothetical protein
MKDQKRLPFHLEHDALSETMQIDDGSALHRGERRIDRSQQERGRESHSRDAMADHAGPKRVQVEEDVRQFRHVGGYSLDVV